MEGHFESIVDRTKGKNLICIQDTSEYCYEKHRGILKEGSLGVISDDRSLGVRVHPMLVLDAEDEFAYGFSSFEIINRVDRRTDEYEGAYMRLPIEDKESYRWLGAIQNTKLLLNEAKSLTIVSDRESDIYQLWSRVPDSKTHLVIRTSLRRIFQDDDGEELDPYNRSNLIGQTKITIPKDYSRNLKGREACLEVFVHKAWTKKPGKLRQQKNNSDAEKVQVNIIVAREILGPTDNIQDRIEWNLLTDIKAESLKEAESVISNYKARWNIEQVFRITKKQGFQLEDSQLETAHALENLIAMVFIAAVRILQMVKSRKDENLPGLDLFDKNEMTLLAKINRGMEGKADKSKNKYKPGSLAFAIWVIARLGNWKPQDRDPAGPITLLKGWITLQHYLQVNRILSG